MKNEATSCARVRNSESCWEIRRPSPVHSTGPNTHRFQRTHSPGSDGDQFPCISPFQIFDSNHVYESYCTIQNWDVKLKSHNNATHPCLGTLSPSELHEASRLTAVWYNNMATLKLRKYFQERELIVLHSFQSMETLRTSMFYVYILG